MFNLAKFNINLTLFSRIRQVLMYNWVSLYKYCKATFIRGNFISRIYFQYTGSQRLIFAIKLYPDQYCNNKPYDKDWFVVRNIHDDESLANLEKISSAWIKVGLQYSYCTFILIISTQVTVWPLGLLFDIQTNIIHIYIYVFVYTFSMPWYHFPLILGHLNYGLPIWFTVTVSTDFTYCLFWFYSFILLMCSKGHRENCK